MPNVEGPKEKKRRLLASVVYSRMLYAVPIWPDALEKKYTEDMLTKAQRYIALPISGYRTASTSAALVVAGLPLIDLLPGKRKEIYASMVERMLIMARSEEILTKSALKKEARIRLFNKWEKRWNDKKNGKMDS